MLQSARKSVDSRFRGTRRELLIGIAASALLITSGCATFRRSSDLDRATDDLDSLLKEIGSEGGNGDTLAAIADKISTDAHALLDVQGDFASEFNRKAADSSVSDAVLLKLVNDYEVERNALRNGLLRYQDELRAAVPADAWPDVLEVLNRKSEAIAPKRGREG